MEWGKMQSRTLLVLPLQGAANVRLRLNICCSQVLSAQQGCSLGGGHADAYSNAAAMPVTQFTATQEWGSKCRTEWVKSWLTGASVLGVGSGVPIHEGSGV